MGLIPPAERRDLIIDLTEHKPNSWGYVALACLLQVGYIKRVLSLNFDTQLQKACSLIGLHPNVYDCSHSGIKDFSLIKDPSIIHLHGQSFGFIHKHDEKQTKDHIKKIRPLVLNTINGSSSVFVGYSGYSDELLDLVAKTFKEEHSLTWLGHEDAPPDHLSPLLKKRHTKFHGGIDFDSVMVNLARQLNCWPPQILSDPVSLVHDWVSNVNQYRPSRDEVPLDLGFTTKNKMRTISSMWSEHYGDFDNIELEMISLNYKKVIQEYDKLSDKKKILSSEHHSRIISWAFSEKSYQLWNEVKVDDRTTDEELKLLDEAEKLISIAVDIKQNPILVSNYIAVKVKKYLLSGDIGEIQAAELIFRQTDKMKLNPRTLNNAIALYLHLYKHDRNDFHKKMIEETWENLRQIDSSKSYNYICFCAIDGRFDNCKTLLEEGKASGSLPKADVISKDKDLLPLHQFAWFQKLFALAPY